MITCTQCGSKLKAGLEPTVIIQKAQGLVLSTAEPEQVKSGQTWTCEQCLNKERNVF